MKMGNTEPRVGLKPTSLAFPASVLTLHHIAFPDVTTIPTPTCLCSSPPQEVRPDHYTCMPTYICGCIYTHAGMVVHVYVYLHLLIYKLGTLTVSMGQRHCVELSLLNLWQALLAHSQLVNTTEQLRSQQSCSKVSTRSGRCNMPNV